MRERPLLVALLSMCLMAVLPAPVRAEPMPVTAARPADRAHVAVTPRGFVFEIVSPADRIAYMNVEVANWNGLGEDGTLADDPDHNRDSFQLSELQSAPGTFRGPSGNKWSGRRWTTKPGTYFWQAVGGYFECGRTCTYRTYESPVYTLHVDASPALTLRRARAAVHAAIRRETKRRPRGLEDPCRQVGRSRVNCKPAWHDSRFVYRGRLIVTRDFEGTWYEFDGSRASRRCVRRHESAREGVRRCGRPIQW